MNKKNSFTLVELLVVMAILGILSLVGVVTYSKLTDKAKNSNDNYIVIQMNNALRNYQVDSKIESISDVYKALNYSSLLDDLTPSTINTYYYWDSTTNNILYVNDSKEVLNDVEHTYDTTKWFILDYSYSNATITSQNSSFNDLFN